SSLGRELLSVLKLETEWFLGVPELTNGGFGLIKGVVGRANEWARLDVFETDPLAKNFVLGKFVRVNVADDREMFTCRLQILAERQDIRALRSEFLHGGKHFAFFFSQAKHQTRLRRHVGMGLLGASQQFERSLIHCALAHLAIKPRYG